MCPALNVHDLSIRDIRTEACVEALAIRVVEHLLAV
jgi:hypothetical protein